MKELTIEQKAKKYNEAVKMAKEFLTSPRTCFDIEQLYNIFPELRESEDERIRKAILELVRQSSEVLGKQNQNNMITWLEKQGEERTINYPIEGMFPYTEPADTLDGEIENIWNKLRNCDNTFTAAKSGFYEVIHHFANWLEKQSYTKKDVDDAYLKGICNTKHELEKQGEQPRYSIGDVLCDKSCTTLNKDTQPNFEIIDIRDGMYICDKGSFPISQQDEYELVAKKIEPKFQSGQWIVWQNKYYKVNYNGCGYELIDQNGLSTSLEYGTVDTSARLWNITKDAKNGDVLAMSAGAFIYNGNRGGGSCPGCYCGINTLGNFKVGVEHHWTGKPVFPATKEQRDTLFAKMKEAGYAFDFEKKELKKLGQPEVTKTSDQEEIAEIPFGAKDSELQEAIYNIPKGFHAEINDDKVVIKKGEKPAAWSEEDIRNIQDIDSILFYDKDLPEETCMRLRNWLKSLKPQTEMVEALRTEYEKGRADAIAEFQKAWSEEDEKMLEGIVNTVKDIRCQSLLSEIEIYDDYIDWLKSLKDRYTWKPSKGQLECIDVAIDKVDKDHSPFFTNRAYLTLKALKKTT